MLTSKQITTSELDFDAIKNNLKTFLGAQSTLVDYDFDGSVMSVLLDVLAYNTHYNALYTNLAINEMFIDSASKRASLVSLSKLMGYVSTSVKSSRANINVNIVPASSNNSLSFTLPAGTIFGTSIGNLAYKFITLQAYSATRSNNTSSYQINNIEIVEGSRNRITYQVTGIDSFVVPDRKADISTLKISVFPPGNTTNSVVFTPADSILSVSSTSNVFFLKQREDQFYQIYFGDGNFGASIVSGSTVVIEYSISAGSITNLSNVFVYSAGADSSANYYCTTSVVAIGGAEEETIDSIRFNAPRAFTTNHRAVTADDYSAVLFENFPGIDCINVWGGQDNIPPVYGVVNIAAKPIGRDNFTVTEKNQMISTILQSRSVITVKPMFVDPKYLTVDFSTNVYYDPRTTTLASGDIGNLVLGVINNYAVSLGKFNRVYRHSNLISAIDTCEKSIISNISTISVRYSMEPAWNVINDYIIRIGNPISVSADATVKTTRFYHVNYSDPCFIQNVGTIMNLYTQSATSDSVLIGPIGSYTSDGVITLSGLTVVGLLDAKFEVSFTPFSYDVVPINNYIVRLAPNTAKINIIVDNISMDASGAQNHIFSGSR